MSITFVVMVSHVCAYVQSHQIACLKHVQVFARQLFLNKAIG